MNYQVVLDAMCEHLKMETYRDAVVVLQEFKKLDKFTEHAYNRFFREHAKTKVGDLASKHQFENAQELIDIVEQMLMIDADTDFDAYMQLMEWRRDPNKRFYQPRRHVLWPVVCDLQDLYDDKLDFYALSTPPRIGKAVADTTPVLTKDGWKNHGELVVGDEVVSPEGEFVRVIAVHNPCEMEYEVEFTNGQKVVCHGNHEWVVYDRARHNIVTIETSMMYERKLTSGNIGHRGGRYVFQLQNRTPLDCDDVELPVMPYSFGVWLGDGRNKNPDICGAQDDIAIISKSIMLDGYEPSWEAIHNKTGVKYVGFKSMRKPLQSIGLCYSRKRVPKYIPDVYLTASKAQRMELLAGLLDTDGSLCKKENRYSFTTAEESLKDCFVELVSTFGWRCSILEHNPVMSSSGIRGKHKYWNVSFSPTEYIPCRLERKQLHDYSKQRRVAVKDVRKINTHEIGRCITVEGGMYCIGEQMVPTHNSTIGCFFMSFSMGNNPNDAHLMSGFSDKLTESFYKEMMSLICDNDTYCFNSIFPAANLVDKNAANEVIDLNTKSRFPTLTCRSVGGTLTGAVEVGHKGILYCDDMVEDYEQALNSDRMDKLYAAYLSQLYDRKLPGAKEFHIGTRWVPNDIIGREEMAHHGNPRYRFRRIPALNENGESNFMYHNGMAWTTEKWLEIKEKLTRDGLDDNWSAKYMCDPYWREGRLYEEDDLQFYEELPEGEPDIILAVCDTKTKGPDYCVQVVDYVYGDNHYIKDVVCDDGLMENIEPRLVDSLVSNNVSIARYESNVAGGKIARDVEGMCISRGLPIVMKTKYSTENKETRILASAGWVKKRCLFLCDEKRNSEYRRFMVQLLSYNAKTKNKHDDVPDAMSMLCNFVGATIKAKVTPIKRPW